MWGMRAERCCCVAAGAAVVGASVIAVTPMTAPPPGVHLADIQLTAGDQPDIVIDVVRHGEMISPYENLLTPSPAFPGAPLSEHGEVQAHDVATYLHSELGDHVAGIFAGQGTREMETAAPFAGMYAPDSLQILPGLNEVDSGIYALDPIESLGGRLAFLTVGAWSLGSPFGLALVPGLGSSDYNGLAFDERFTDAIDKMYDYATAPADPVVSANGQITDVAFNSEASIFAWVIMNVKNPDLPFFINRIIESHTVPNGLSTVLLPNTGIVQIEGNPTDGWTLVSWDGQSIPQDPGLLTDLFVDVRNLVLPTQMALWNIGEAILTSNPQTIMTAVHTGFDQIGSALLQFPVSVVKDIVDAILGTDTAGQAAADTGAALGDVLAAGI